ncbi:hypothetical protein CCO03_08270 [Comamonas serinivorans]|uniref:Uncharacterized protein n=1 Tax=Comamonas serinivorans TaxID=1082851 RepID=A0A1Y0EMN9_9BURK|nr:hypothetical protein [Comamonas serinivorans]ARU04668.1 hypothetical protein CCO03_08270 [Comamonas serinivorans]
MKADDTVWTTHPARSQHALAHAGIWLEQAVSGLSQLSARLHGPSRQLAQGMRLCSQAMPRMAHRMQQGVRTLTQRNDALTLQAWQNPAHSVPAAAAMPPGLDAEPPRPSAGDTPKALLRSIRWVDGDGSQGLVRLRLSGRLSDVCDELERLAAMES